MNIFNGNSLVQVGRSTLGQIYQQIDAGEVTIIAGS